MRIVLCNGVFDLLHPGHIMHLKEARAMGDFLTVGVTTDAGVNKPGRPILSLRERILALSSLAFVDRAFPCTDSLDAILFARPHIFVKGADYMDSLLPEETSLCEKLGCVIRFTSPSGHSTTKLIERIRAA